MELIPLNAILNKTVAEREASGGDMRIDNTFRPIKLCNLRACSYPKCGMLFETEKTGEVGENQLMKCSGCSISGYCSKAHQKNGMRTNLILIVL